jgi:hypothetical protein
MEETEISNVIDQLKCQEDMGKPELGISLFAQNDELTIAGNKLGLKNLAIALLEVIDTKNQIVLSDEDFDFKLAGVELIKIECKDYEPLPLINKEKTLTETLGCWFALAVLAFLVITFFIGLSDVLSWLPKLFVK